MEELLKVSIVPRGFHSRENWWYSNVQGWHEHCRGKTVIITYNTFSFRNTHLCVITCKSCWNFSGWLHVWVNSEWDSSERTFQVMNERKTRNATRSILLRDILIIIYEPLPIKLIGINQPMLRQTDNKPLVYNSEFNPFKCIKKIY